MGYAKNIEGLHSKFIKPRNERSTVAGISKALRRPSSMPTVETPEDEFNISTT